MINIAFLADHPEVIPTLVQWFVAQWPDHYATRTSNDIAQDFRSEANRDRIPVRLLAFAGGELAGTITLREQAISTLPEYRPGLGGLFVVEDQRGQGIGTRLVQAGMEVAWAQGYEIVYTTTVRARGILERLEWQLVRQFVHNDEHLMLFQCKRDLGQQ